MKIVARSREHAGQALVEYAVTLMLIVLVVFVMVVALGPQVVKFWQSAVQAFP